MTSKKHSSTYGIKPYFWILEYSDGEYDSCTALTASEAHRIANEKRPGVPVAEATKVEIIAL